MGSSKLEELGVEDYLNATKGLHNSKGFKEFEKVMQAPKPNITEAADDFNVTRPTFYEWIKLYNVKIKAKENI